MMGEQTRSESPFSGRPTIRTTQHDIPDEAKPVHYSVLVPNMRGLDNLLELARRWLASGNDSRLTDEIAVFVSATEV